MTPHSSRNDEGADMIQSFANWSKDAIMADVCAASGAQGRNHCYPRAVDGQIPGKYASPGQEDPSATLLCRVNETEDCGRGCAYQRACILLRNGLVGRKKANIIQTTRLFRAETHANEGSRSVRYTMLVTELPSSLYNAIKLGTHRWRFNPEHYQRPGRIRSMTY